MCGSFRSTVLSKERGKIIEDGEDYDPLFTPSTLHQAVHTSTCGHVMHADCWQRFGFLFYPHFLLQFIHLPGNTLFIKFFMGKETNLYMMVLLIIF